MAPTDAVPFAAKLSRLARFLLRLYIKFGLCQFLVRLSVNLVRRWRNARMLRDVPHMRTTVTPILGMLPALIANRKRLHHWLDEGTRGMRVAKFMGPIWDPTLMVVGVRDPISVRHMLKDSFPKYTKTHPVRQYIWKILKEWLGDGIFTIQHGVGAPDGGEFWLQQRKIAAQIFSQSNFTNNMHGVFVTKAKILREVLQDGKVADMQMHFFNFTMDSVMQIFFGEESNTIGGERNTYGAAFDAAHRGFFEYAVTSMPFVSFVRYFPWPLGGFDGVLAQLDKRLSVIYHDFRVNCRKLDRESERIIEKCRTDPRLGSRTDLLALFMQAVEREGHKIRDPVKYLRDAVLNFVIAGRDTTACTLSWMFYILGTNPEIQERVTAEVDSVLAGEEPTLQSVQHSSMPLLHALIYEALRLYPPVPFNSKEVQCDDVLPDGSRIPKHSVVVYLPWAMGRDPEVYPNPEKVVLERWIPFKQPPAHEFPVFQAGPRMCLGVNMAVFEAKVLAAMLLQEFRFELSPGEKDKIHYSRMITISVCNSLNQDSHNLWLIPHRRKQVSKSH